MTCSQPPITNESEADDGQHVAPLAAPRPRWWQRLGRGVLLYALVPYLAVTLAFTVLQRRFLYPATKVPALSVADAGLPSGRLREVSLATPDGLRLKGWLFAADELPGHAADSSAGPLSSGRRLILYFPGNGRNRLDRTADCRELAMCGCDVLLFDYRGYADNPGSPSEPGLTQDSQQVWTLATQELGVPADRILVFGESLGGAVATRLAAAQCDAGTPPGGLVLSSTFADLRETVGWHYPWFPFRWLLRDAWPSIVRIPHVTCPIVQIHGARDDIVPLTQGRRLFAAAPAQSGAGVPKQFVELADTGHNEIPIAVLQRVVRELSGKWPTD